MKLAIAADPVVILNSVGIIDSGREYQVVTFAGDGTYVRSSSSVELRLRLVSVCLPLPHKRVFVWRWHGSNCLAKCSTREHHPCQDDEQTRFHHDDLIRVSVLTGEYYADTD